MTAVLQRPPAQTTPALPPRRPRRAAVLRTSRIGTLIALVVAAAFALLWLIPLLWAVDTSVKPESETTRIPLDWIPTRFTFDAYRQVLAAGQIGQWLVNSAITAVVVTVLVVLLSSMAAYGFARTRFRGRKLLFALTIAGIMVPPQILVVPLFAEMVSLGLVDTYWGIILPQVAAPIMVYILKKFFDGLPRELEESALIDGASRLRIYWQIIMPLSRQVLAAVAIFTFVITWNNFLWPFVVATDPDTMTLPVGLATVQTVYGVRYAQIMATVVLGALPLLVVFILFQRQIVRGIAHTGLGN
jgi:multiple sugar transport system permease protein